MNPRIRGEHYIAREVSSAKRPMARLLKREIDQPIVHHVDMSVAGPEPLGRRGQFARVRYDGLEPARLEACPGQQELWQEMLRLRLVIHDRNDPGISAAALPLPFAHEHVSSPVGEYPLGIDLARERTGTARPLCAREN